MKFSAEVAGLIAAILIAILFSEVVAVQQCDAIAQQSTCAQMCPPVCPHKQVGYILIYCGQECVTGLKCPDGLLRTEGPDGNDNCCVKEENCPPVIG